MRTPLYRIILSSLFIYGLTPAYVCNWAHVCVVTVAYVQPATRTPAASVGFSSNHFHANSKQTVGEVKNH
jgi:hypothetical protein